MKKLTLAPAVLLAPVLLSVPAFAADAGDGGFGEGIGGGRDFGRLQASVEDLVGVMEQVWAVLVSNPFFLVLLAGSLLVLGIRIFRKVKGAAK